MKTAGKKNPSSTYYNRIEKEDGLRSCQSYSYLNASIGFSIAAFLAG